MTTKPNKGYDGMCRAVMRATLFCLFAIVLTLTVTPATAQTVNTGANPAERFVSQQILSGLSILADNSVPPETRRAKFEGFLLGNTDLARIALFTLGDAAKSATPAQRDAFIATFKTYATAVYRSYFQLYSGQGLTVTGSDANAPGDTIVHTRLTNANGGPPLTMDFRVRTDGPRPLVTDIGFAGIWLAVTERADFAGYLAHSGGTIDALTAHLNDVARTVR